MLHQALGQAALANHQPVRKAHELGVGKLGARAQALPVVQQRLHTGVQQRLIEALGRLPHMAGFMAAHGNHRHLEGRHRFRPDDAAVVMVLLDDGAHQAGHAHAVAAHAHGHRLAGLVQHACLHGLGVLVAEFEDMPHLYAALHQEPALAVRAGVAGLDFAQVLDAVAGDVPLPVEVQQVPAVPVGAGGEVAHCRRRPVHNDRHFQSLGPQGAGRGADGGADFLWAGEAEGRRHALDLLRLHLAQLMVAAQDQRQEAAVLALGDERLDGLGDGDAMVLHQAGNGLDAGGRKLLHCLHGFGFVRRRLGLGQLHVGGIGASVAEHQPILAGFGKHMELH